MYIYLDVSLHNQALKKGVSFRRIPLDIREKQTNCGDVLVSMVGEMCPDQPANIIELTSTGVSRHISLERPSFSLQYLANTTVFFAWNRILFCIVCYVSSIQIKFLICIG